MSFRIILSRGEMQGYPASMAGKLSNSIIFSEKVRGETRCSETLNSPWKHLMQRVSGNGTWKWIPCLHSVSPPSFLHLIRMFYLAKETSSKLNYAKIKLSATFFFHFKNIRAKRNAAFPAYCISKHVYIYISIFQRLIQSFLKKHFIQLRISRIRSNDYHVKENLIKKIMRIIT